MFRRTFLAALAAFSLAPAFAAPLEVTDAQGRKVTINTPVCRVVATFNYEEFTAIAGVDGWKKVVAMSREPWAGWRPAIFARYAKVMGTEARAEALATLDETQFKDILARVETARAQGRPRKKVYVELARDGAEMIGNTYNNTMWGKIITTLGAENLATGRIPAASRAAQCRSGDCREPRCHPARRLLLGEQAKGCSHRL